jgi:hypothetical protein
MLDVFWVLLIRRHSSLLAEVMLLLRLSYNAYFWSIESPRTDFQISRSKVRTDFRSMVDRKSERGDRVLELVRGWKIYGRCFDENKKHGAQLLVKGEQRG